RLFQNFRRNNRSGRLGCYLSFHNRSPLSPTISETFVEHNTVLTCSYPTGIMPLSVFRPPPQRPAWRRNAGTFGLVSRGPSSRVVPLQPLPYGYRWGNVRAL